jgi:hypothetical protein
MKMRFPLMAAAAAALLLSLESGQSQGLPMVFDAPAGADTNHIWVQFVTGSVSGTYKDSNGKSHALATNTPYSLAQITSPKSAGGGAPANVPAMLVSSYNGRVYINYGPQGLKSLGGGYTPDAASSSDPNFTTRYQYFEPTFAGVAGGTGVNVDVSYIDFFGISLELMAKNTSHATNSPQTSGAGQVMAQAAATASLTTNAAVLPGTGDLLPSANFARVLGPHLASSGMYHDFSSYLAFLDGQTATIKGVFNGVGTQPTGTRTTQAQTYDYLATFDSGTQMVTLVAQADSGNGTDVSIPASKQGPGVGNTVTITITYAALNTPTGIYGANPVYSVNNTTYPYSPIPTTGIVNDVYGRVVGDLCGGLDFGYIGSTTTFNASAIGGASSQAIGTLNSTQWWGGGSGASGTFVMPGATTTYPNSGTPAIQRVYFSKVQSNSLYYDPYADKLSPFTTSYTFPFGDRLGDDLLYMDNGTDTNAYLLVSILPDVSSSGYSVRIFGKHRIVTTKPRWVLRGSATGTVSRVTFNVGKIHGKAKGTRKWRLVARLKPGRNVVYVTAIGANGASRPARVVIIRRS